MCRRECNTTAGVEPAPLTVELARALRQPGSAGPAARTHAAAIMPRSVQHPSQMIGRERERERARLADAASMIAVVVGEPGVGKSHLLEEALPRAGWIGCQEVLQQVTFGPLVEWIDDQRDSLPDIGALRRDLGSLVSALLGGEQLPPADPATGDFVVLLARRKVVRLRLAYRSTEGPAALRELLDPLDGIGGIGAGAAVERVEPEALSPFELTDFLAAAGAASEPRDASQASHVSHSANRLRLRVVRARIQLERSDAAQAEADALAALDEAADPPDRAEAFMLLALDTARRNGVAWTGELRRQLRHRLGHPHRVSVI